MRHHCRQSKRRRTFTRYVSHLITYSTLVLSQVYAQSAGAAFPSLFFPRGVGSFGLGFQGVAVPSKLSMIDYNPAHVAALKAVTVEGGKFGGFPTFFPGYRLGWLSGGFTTEFGNFAAAYFRFNLGQIALVDPSTTTRVVEPFEESVGLFYGVMLFDNVAVGAGIRYMRSVFYGFSNDSKAQSALVSAGTIWQPVFLEGRLRLGASLLNFGTPVKHESYQAASTSDPRPPSTTISSDAAPAEIRLGIATTLLKSSTQKLSATLEGSRSVAEIDQSTYEGKSSFRSLFTQWNGFPRDVIVHTGLTYRFLPIPFAPGWSAANSISMGIFDDPNYSGRNWMTASWQLNIETPIIAFDIGVGTIWHHMDDIPVFFNKSIPEEEFHFSVTLFRGRSEEKEMFERIVVSAGIAVSTPLGRYMNMFASSGNQVSVDAAFYTSANFAVVPSFVWVSNPFGGFLSGVGGRHSIIVSSLASRFHPGVLVQPLFVQAGLFMMRWIPTSERPNITFFPSYRYNPGIVLDIGYSVDVGANLSLIPAIGYSTFFGGVPSGSAPRVGGYSQWTFGVGVGYNI